MTGLLALVIAYLIGAIPFGYLLVRMTTGKDVRSSGSGNIGATNVLRTTGRAPTLGNLGRARELARQGANGGPFFATKPETGRTGIEGAGDGIAARWLTAL